MGQAALRLVEKEDMDKVKALEAAVGQIERSFGKGSIMKLGTDQVVETEAISSSDINRNEKISFFTRLFGN